MKNPFLIGPTVYLRPLERADAPVLVGWLNHPDVTRTLRIYRPINLQAEEEYLERIRQSEQDVSLGVGVRATDRFVGVIGLHDIDFKNRHAGLGIVIGEPDEWGKGYGTEASRLLVGYAFETLNLNRVWLQVYEYNTRARRAYQRVGFRQEGVQRQERYAQGRFWDTILMAVLREEWFGERPS
jgi:RimJ/RimL family protein N-acetyltransferase